MNQFLEEIMREEGNHETQVAEAVYACGLGSFLGAQPRKRAGLRAENSSTIN